MAISFTKPPVTRPSTNQQRQPAAPVQKPRTIFTSLVSNQLTVTTTKEPASHAAQQRPLTTHPFSIPISPSSYSSDNSSIEARTIARVMESNQSIINEIQTLLDGMSSSISSYPSLHTNTSSASIPSFTTGSDSSHHFSALFPIEPRCCQNQSSRSPPQIGSSGHSDEPKHRRRGRPQRTRSCVKNKSR